MNNRNIRSALSAIVLLTFCNAALAQFESTLNKNRLIESVGKLEGLDTKNLPKAQGPSGKIAGVTNPEVHSSRSVYIQGRGDVERVELSLFASIKNPGTTSRAFRIIAEVEGGRGFRSGPFSIPAGETSRRPIRFRSDYELSGRELPINIVLQSLDGAELDRVPRLVSIPNGSENMRLFQAQPADLAVEDVRIETDVSAGGLSDLRFRNGVPYKYSGHTKATITLRNSGTERWGYDASLRVHYSRGRPGNLTRLEGANGMTRPIPGGLQPGERKTMDLEFQRGLAPGYYYTARVTISSSADQVQVNDTQTLVFFVEEGGRVIPI
jgi:hypothetical protein